MMNRRAGGFFCSWKRGCPQNNINQFGMRVLLFLVAWAALCAGAPAPPPPPLWYFAPVLSGGGYSTEAIALLHGLVNVLPADEKPSAVRVSHHGDAISTEHYLGLPDHYREALDAAMRPRPPLPARDFVVVCHSEPGAWDPPRYHTTRCPPEGYGRAGALAVIGRTMFETDRLEDEHVRRCNRMREVWVPTSWSARVLEAAGVRKEKIRVVPEAVDVDAFDPAALSTATGGGDRAPYDATGNGVLAVGPRLDDDAASGVTKFLSVFKWEARKAPEVLLDAYFREFSASDAVALFLRCELLHEDGATWCASASWPPRKTRSTRRRSRRGSVFGARPTAKASTRRFDLARRECSFSLEHPTKRCRRCTPPRTRSCFPRAEKAGGGRTSRRWRWRCP